MKRRTRSLTSLAALATVVPLAACGLEPASGYAPPVAPAGIEEIEGAGDVTITVGAKNFTEQLLLGKIAVLALRAAGYHVTDATNIPGSAAAREAMLSGNTDVQWEYTGSAWTSYMGQPKIADFDEQFQAVHDADLENGITWLEPAPMNNTYGFAMGPQAAEEIGIDSLSELAEVPVEERTLCVESEFRSRSDGLEPMLEHYGIPLDDPQGIPSENISVLDTGAIYQATANGECNFGEIFTTDGRIQSLDLTVIEDDRQFFPPYDVAPIVRTEVLEENPEIEEVFAQISPRLDTEQLIELNGRIDVEGQEPADVAMDWLVEEGLVSRG
ncbi:glycine betaine ABC transporter substrate-binding protein [Georgenia alba]|uniref:Glycine betaine ABC transporter substrate-binding protein n=1 Tax=Georgenia alba TaxID=2233858 RepID=A0ABW2Q4R3_9MICO